MEEEDNGHQVGGTAAPAATPATEYPGGALAAAARRDGGAGRDPVGAIPIEEHPVPLRRQNVGTLHG